LADIDILVPGPVGATLMAGLDGFRLHEPWKIENPDEREAMLGRVSDTIRGIARGFLPKVDAALIDRLPRLEIVASFGVGYDAVDAVHAARRGVIVTNTPDVLTEETADTAMGLLLMTVRELSAAERFLRAGRWGPEGDFPVSPGTLRDRTVGIVGLGRIGAAIARRVAASAVPVVYHSRTERPEVPWRHYDSLLAMARDVDTLVVALPGGAGTIGMINAEVLEALGPRGVVINIGRGSTIDEDALIAALAERRIFAAGLDVFRNEPRIDPRFLGLDNAVLLPHVGSSSVLTRNAMEQLVADNLRSWFFEGKPLTPVAETPWPREQG
jgi:lactate dehydrogenase-like 2-hydroxyacid dehydrogenase